MKIILICKRNKLLGFSPCSMQFCSKGRKSTAIEFITKSKINHTETMKNMLENKEWAILTEYYHSIPNSEKCSFCHHAFIIALEHRVANTVSISEEIVNYTKWVQIEYIKVTNDFLKEKAEFLPKIPKHLEITDLDNSWRKHKKLKMIKILGELANCKTLDEKFNYYIKHKHEFLVLVSCLKSNTFRHYRRILPDKLDLEIREASLIVRKYLRFRFLIKIAILLLILFPSYFAIIKIKTMQQMLEKISHSLARDSIYDNISNTKQKAALIGIDYDDKASKEIPFRIPFSDQIINLVPLSKNLKNNPEYKENYTILDDDLKEIACRVIEESGLNHPVREYIQEEKSQAKPYFETQYIPIRRREDEPFYDILKGPIIVENKKGQPTEKPKEVHFQLVDNINLNERLSNVRGIKEAIDEIKEVIFMINNSELYTDAGAKIIKGVLLSGKPGTGKTLIARSIAGECNINFLFVTGSDFDDTYVGVGSKRIKQLFELARKSKPCIIFIDEIDSLLDKSRRSSTEHSSNRATINQFLAEVDGFKGSDRVFIIGATNHEDSLDPAAIRPGRFDKVIHIPVPDSDGREEILDFYISKIKLKKDELNNKVIALMTPGFTGAEIENLINQSVVYALKRKSDEVKLSDISECRDRLLMGIARKNYEVPEKRRYRTALHEAGHALVCYKSDICRPTLHKLTIIPRGSAEGVVSCELYLLDFYTSK